MSPRRSSRREAQLHMFATLSVTGIALAAAAAGAEVQQKFPEKPVRLVVATTPASQPDALARILGQKLSESWGRPVVMDIRPGAGGALAANVVARAAPDGHTLLYSLPSFAIITSAACLCDGSAFRADAVSRYF